MPLCEAQQVIQKIEKILKDKYGFTHTTLQAEVDRCDNKNLFV